MLIATLIGASGGCRTVKNQIKALAGGDTTGTSATSANTVKGPHPQSWGFIQGPPPVLDQTFRVHHDPSELNPARGLRMPKFDWEHSGRSSGAFSEGSGMRHQRGS